MYTILVSATSPDGTFSAAPTLGRFANIAGIGGRGASGLQVNLASAPPTVHVADARTVAQGQTFALDNLAAFSYANAAAVTASDGVSGNFTYAVDWGDGSAPFTGTNVDVISSGSTSLPFLGALRSDTPDGPLAHAYSEAGTYYLAVTVTFAASGRSDTQTIPVNVVALTPVISGLPENNTCNEGDAINLSAGVSPASADPVAYWWEIDDSSGNAVFQTTDPNPSYTFTYPDTYTVSLVATVDGVQTAPATAAITVNNLAPSFVNPTIPDANASVGQTFTLPPVAFTDPGLSNTHTATIDWADGNVMMPRLRNPLSPPPPGEGPGVRAALRPAPSPTATPTPPWGPASIRPRSP